MKRFLIAGLIAGTMALSFTSCGGGSATSSVAVPNDVLDEFYDMYPTASNVDWELKDGLYEAEFEVGDKNMKAIYTSGGDLVRVDN